MSPARRAARRALGRSMGLVSVIGVRLLAMQNAVPKRALGRFDGLGDPVRLIEAGKIKIEPAEGRFGRARMRTQIHGCRRIQLFEGLLRGAAAGRQRHEALTIAVERENGRNAGSISLWIEFHPFFPLSQMNWASNRL